MSFKNLVFVLFLLSFWSGLAQANSPSPVWAVATKSASCLTDNGNQVTFEPGDEIKVLNQITGDRVCVVKGATHQWFTCRNLEYDDLDQPTKIVVVVPTKIVVVVPSWEAPDFSEAELEGLNCMADALAVPKGG